MVLYTNSLFSSKWILVGCYRQHHVHHERKIYLSLAQVYVDDIIFRSTDQRLSFEFAEVMSKRFKISMTGELTFFLGLKVKELSHIIFFCQAKYITYILKKVSLIAIQQILQCPHQYLLPLIHLVLM